MDRQADIDQLCALGFTPEHARHALARHPTLERAADFLFSLSEKERDALGGPVPHTKGGETAVVALVPAVGGEDNSEDEAEWETDGGEDNDAGVGGADDDEEEEECKMVLGVRIDLGMSVGKMCSQAAHAAVDLARGGGAKRKCRPSEKARQKKWRKSWLDCGAAKIALAVPSHDVMLALKKAAEQRGIPVVVISDAGRTQVAPGTETVVGIGPAPRSLVDQCSGSLKLL